MPTASEGKRSFPVVQTNSYGRDMLKKYSRAHDTLVQSAPVVVHDKIDPIYSKQMEILHKAERFRPSYNIMKQRHDDDIVMSNLIRDAGTACDHHLDAHVLRFRELRRKHPNHKPCWAEQYEITKTMSSHEEIIKKSRKWIDDEPPRHALHYRTLLRRTPFTKGGFPRKQQLPTKKTPKLPKKKKDLLPSRRTSQSTEMLDEASPDVAKIRNALPPRAQTAEPFLGGGQPSWAAKFDSSDDNACLNQTQRIQEEPEQQG